MHFVPLIHYSLFVSLSFISLCITHVICMCVNKNIKPLDGAPAYSGDPAEPDPLPNRRGVLEVVLQRSAVCNRVGAVMSLDDFIATAVMQWLHFVPSYINHCLYPFYSVQVELAR